MEAERIAGELSERDALLVLMGNVGYRHEDWRHAEPAECAVLVARDLLKSGPALMGVGLGFYPTALGKEVAVHVYAKSITPDDRLKILERDALHKIPERLRHLYDYQVSDDEPDGDWSWYEQPVYALNEFGRAVAKLLEDSL